MHAPAAMANGRSLHSLWSVLKRLGGQACMICVEYGMQFSMLRRRAVSGGFYLRIFRPSRRCDTISTAGATVARSRRSTKHWPWRAASLRAEKQNRRLVQSGAYRMALAGPNMRAASATSMTKSVCAKVFHITFGLQIGLYEGICFII